MVQLSNVRLKQHLNLQYFVVDVVAISWYSKQTKSCLLCTQKNVRLRCNPNTTAPVQGIGVEY